MSAVFVVVAVAAAAVVTIAVVAVVAASAAFNVVKVDVRFSIFTRWDFN